MKEGGQCIFRFCKKKKKKEKKLPPPYANAVVQEEKPQDGERVCEL